MPVQVEVVVEGPAGAVAAEQAGAARVELCSALIVGGLTPSLGTVVTTVQRVRNIGVQVLIRPREGDFVFTPDEIATMVADIESIRSAVDGSGVRVGFVIGALTAGCEIDRDVTARLVAACDGAPTTFHRAFDLTPDLERSLDTLIELGVHRVLTSGGAPRATDGVSALERLVRRAAGRISVMPGGSVRPHNAADILAMTGADELHCRAAVTRANILSPREPRVPMASSTAPSEELREETSADKIRDMLATVGAAAGR